MSFKRIFIFIYWILVQYKESVWNVIRLKGLGSRGDKKYSKHWLVSKTLLMVLFFFFIFNSNKYIGLAIIFIISYMLFLQEYEKEEWVGWYRRKKDPEYNKKKWWARSKEL